MYFEDIRFSTELLYDARTIGVIRKPYYFYRKRGNSIAGKATKQKIDDKFQAFTQIKTFLETKGVFLRYQNLFLVRFLPFCVYTSFNDYFSLSKAERDEELDNYMLRIRKSKLLRRENLLLLRRLGLSLPKNEKEGKKAYLSAYYGLKGLIKPDMLYIVY